MAFLSSLRSRELLPGGYGFHFALTTYAHVRTKTRSALEERSVEFSSTARGSERHSQPVRRRAVDRGRSHFVPWRAALA